MSSLAKFPELCSLELLKKECENRIQGKPLSGYVRVDPWECYQDTWQTTCSVLEHHRDLMKVSWAMAGQGGWPPAAGQAGEGCCWPTDLVQFPASQPAVWDSRPRAAGRRAVSEEPK